MINKIQINFHFLNVVINLFMLNWKIVRSQKLAAIIVIEIYRNLKLFKTKFKNRTFVKIYLDKFKLVNLK